MSITSVRVNDVNWTVVLSHDRFLTFLKLVMKEDRLVDQVLVNHLTFSIDNIKLDFNVV